jgi:hypothetical protein
VSITNGGNNGAITDSTDEDDPTWIYIVTGVVTALLIACIIITAWLVVRHGEMREMDQDGAGDKEFHSAVFDREPEERTPASSSSPKSTRPSSRASTTTSSSIYDIPPPPAAMYGTVFAK